jgi:tight adherence protein B
MSSASCTALAVYPTLYKAWEKAALKAGRYQDVRVQEASKVLEDVFIDVKPLWLKLAYTLTPLCTGVVAHVSFENPILTLVGVGLGFLLPDQWVKFTRARRLRRFRDQLVDGLFILSSSLRAGLSLIQAIEQVHLEMGAPMSQEFGLMLKAHRLGQTFEQIIHGLNRRVPCEEVDLLCTALLVARETGGDVTTIISDLVGTIRERKKLLDKVRTLTLQGRLQAYIMSFLPVIFAMFIRTISPTYFDSMLHSTIGQVALLIALGLWLVGMFLLFKLSKVEV